MSLDCKNSSGGAEENRRKIVEFMEESVYRDEVVAWSDSAINRHLLDGHRPNQWSLKSKADRAKYMALTKDNLLRPERGCVDITNVELSYGVPCRTPFTDVIQAYYREQAGITPQISIHIIQQAMRFASPIVYIDGFGWLFAHIEILPFRLTNSTGQLLDMDPRTVRPRIKSSRLPPFSVNMSNVLTVSIDHSLSFMKNTFAVSRYESPMPGMMQLKELEGHPIFATLFKTIQHEVGLEAKISRKIPIDLLVGSRKFTECLDVKTGSKDILSPKCRDDFKNSKSFDDQIVFIDLIDDEYDASLNNFSDWQWNRSDVSDSEMDLVSPDSSESDNE